MTNTPISTNEVANNHGRPGSANNVRQRAGNWRRPLRLAWKWRDGGSCSHSSTVLATAMIETTPMPQRQPQWSAMMPASRRPLMPPMALPPMYRPIARPSARLSISSTR
ncbi:hypothetical protein D3C73_1095760 [compost metagenome]